jgi:hypothetical protein
MAAGTIPAAGHIVEGSAIPLETLRKERWEAETRRVYDAAKFSEYQTHTPIRHILLCDL